MTLYVPDLAQSVIADHLREAEARRLRAAVRAAARDDRPGRISRFARALAAVRRPYAAAPADPAHTATERPATPAAEQHPTRRPVPTAS